MHTDSIIFTEGLRITLLAENWLLIITLILFRSLISFRFTSVFLLDLITSKSGLLNSTVFCFLKLKLSLFALVLLLGSLDARLEARFEVFLLTFNETETTSALSSLGLTSSYKFTFK